MRLLNRRLAIVAAALLLGGLVLLSGGCGGPPPGEVHVTITGMAFNPANIVISPGTKVVWMNASSAAHTSTSKDWTMKAFMNKSLPSTAWNSFPLNPGQSFSRTFDQKGSFDYFCMVHPYMKGNVTVK